MSCWATFTANVGCELDTPVGLGHAKPTLRSPFVLSLVMTLESRCAGVYHQVLTCIQEHGQSTRMGGNRSSTVNSSESTHVTKPQGRRETNLERK